MGIRKKEEAEKEKEHSSMTDKLDLAVRKNNKQPKFIRKGLDDIYPLYLFLIF